MRYFFLSFLLFFSLGFLNPAKAQQLSDLTAGSIEVTLIPANPREHENVQVSIVSYMTDLDSAGIVWQVNGKTIKSGIGARTVNFQVGDIGEKITLVIKIQTKEGEDITKTIEFSPAGVDLIWQSNSYTPPFYKGKAMFAHQDSITIIAIPHMTSSGEFDPGSYIYKWTQNGRALQSESGYGKNTITINGSVISRPLKIEVEVSTPYSYAAAYGYTTINPIDPFVLLYSKSPLYGIQFQKALAGESYLSTPEITVAAIPMFFDVRYTTSANIGYKWSINGEFINNDPAASTQVFRPIEGMSGTSNITVKVEHIDKILQYAVGKFSLGFGNKKQ